MGMWGFGADENEGAMNAVHEFLSYLESQTTGAGHGQLSEKLNEAGVGGPGVPEVEDGVGLPDEVHKQILGL